MNAFEPLLCVSHLVKRYEGAAGSPALTILDDVSLSVERGESVAIVGPSGSGKSTLLNLIGTLDAPTAGEIRLEGRRIDLLAPAQSAALRCNRLGFIFQMHHLMPQCSALENVLIPTLAPGAPGRGSAAAQRARDLLGQVGLGARLHHKPGQLSGGECQRVAVVRALINEPDVILADEPTGSLDAASAEEVWSILSRLGRERDAALIVVTHSTSLAATMDRTLGLHAGRLEDRAGRRPAHGAAR